MCGLPLSRSLCVAVCCSRDSPEPAGWRYSLPGCHGTVGSTVLQIPVVTRTSRLCAFMNTPRRIIIIGGVAGGASAAAKSRRVDETAEIHVIERGPYISFANCGLPYYIAGEIDDRAKLIIMTPETFWARSRVQAHVNHEVLSINRKAGTVRIKGPDASEREVPYDKLILSQGAKPIVPPIPGVDLPHVFTLRDIPDMDRIVTFMNERKPQRAVGIGRVQSYDWR